VSRRRRGRHPGRPTDAYWGRHDENPGPPPLITPTMDPSAIPRSLGDPPLSANGLLDLGQGNGDQEG